MRGQKKVPKEKAADEGMKLCLETIAELKQIEGVRGVHIMAIESEEKVPEIVRAADLFPRPETSLSGESDA